ncbi:hypothetical protein CDL15_Pgr025705 [Punica granatum]|uniref:peroxidase n=1 Tax=Punica granatum TaxID=22663 RepID=A0A218WB39_PUNGR|nr:hypothetical protein CDL15_Pgr025705 [Punica granatum]PKI64905.1 hypothetical protein CRG98_014701 [Punica granatum]
MQFHDCFVRGYNGSILIDGASIEKTARPTQLLRGYEVIEDAKKQLKTACLGVVSYADILALAAPNAVAMVSKSIYIYIYITNFYYYYYY